jgi:hypothetical protein
VPKVPDLQPPTIVPTAGLCILRQTARTKREKSMPVYDRYLRVALIVFGLIFIFGVVPLTAIWPSGWAWGHGHSHYLLMIVGLYATLGVFLLMASRDPDANKSLIWFTVWSSVVHAAIMAWQAFGDPAERGHLLGDVPALLLTAIVLGGLMRLRSTDRQGTVAA